ncbi:HIT family protein [Krasilnikovia sp. M28-CT-15]|uniref:HIT family protein n=1 Tax=Krasilnikovia sp. M28-CT-15 TaxID=3373540 RepID=UPI003876C4E8
MPLYHLSNYRTERQLADMLRLEADGICIFCPPHLDHDAVQRTVYRNEHWAVTPNEFPYRGARLHLLMVPHDHVTDLADLDPQAQASFWKTLSWIRDRYDITSYGIGVRNGNGLFTGATIEHVHVHVIVGDVDDPAHEPVRMKLSTRPDREKESRLRDRIRDIDPNQLDTGLA